MLVFIFCFGGALLASLEFLQQFGLLLELFLALFLLLAFEVLLLGELLSSLDLFTPRIQEIIPHLFLSIGLGGFELLVTLFVALSAVGIVAETRSGH